MPPSSAARNQPPAGVQMPGVLGSTGPGTGASFGQRRQGFNEGIVFTVGGGSMDEYGNLQDWAQRTSGQTPGAGGASGGGSGGGAGPAGGLHSGSGVAGSGVRRRVVYGSTELVNASDFLTDALGKLGKEG